jgi:pteridine reductase
MIAINPLDHSTSKVVLITGAANRLGKAIAIELHKRGLSIAIHYGNSDTNAKHLCDEFNQRRSNSAWTFKQDLAVPDASERLVGAVTAQCDRLDYLVNNASIFYPTPLQQTSQELLKSFMTVNWKQPVKLAIEAFPYLKANNGSVVNVVDIYAARGLSEHAAYVNSKTALLESTQQLAYEFSPDVRINAVSPGAILWPNSEPHSADLAAEKAKNELQRKIIENTALKRIGTPSDISLTVAYLLLDASYSTGSNISVDGGRQWYV